jgi:Rieske 2Fe-2S family protein
MIDIRRLQPCAPRGKMAAPMSFEPAYDPSAIARLLAARPAGHSLPQGLYNDPQAFAFDLDAIFRRSWLIVGFEAEVKRPGAWMSAMVGPWPILVVRDRGGSLRGFHNTCRHRGARLCPAGKGTSARLVCPYHRWTYELTGELVHAARMPPEFEPADHALSPIHVESVGGVILVCLADEPPPFAPFRRDLEPLLAPHRLDRAKLAFESVLSERANWKLAMENSRECYHCAQSHPELARTFPVQASAHFDYGEDRRQEDFLARLTGAGLTTGPVEGDWWQAVRFVLNPGALSMTVSGQPAVKRLMCEQGGGDIGSLRFALEPNSFAHATADQLFLCMINPVSPRETHIVSKWLVHEDAVEGVDYDLDELTRLWTATNLQDRDLVENNQAGIDSPGYRPGPYSPEAEALLVRFTDWYCRTAKAFLPRVAETRRVPRSDVFV